MHQLLVWRSTTCMHLQDLNDVQQSGKRSTEASYHNWMVGTICVASVIRHGVITLPRKQMTAPQTLTFIPNE